MISILVHECHERGVVEKNWEFVVVEEPQKQNGYKTVVFSLPHMHFKLVNQDFRA